MESLRGFYQNFRYRMEGTRRVTLDRRALVVLLGR